MRSKGMGKKSRIVAQEKPRPVSKIIITGPLTRKELFHRPLNVSPDPFSKGPSVQGYRCVAAWAVKSSDEQVMDFLEVADQLGNVQRLYQGSPAHNIASIAKEGLHLGWNYCMFGAGIYMGGPRKAMNYTGRGDGARYLLEVEVALGRIKACDRAEKYNLRRLRAEGFNSVGGFAGQTASWGGVLRHDEYVVYATNQVLVHRIFEYQQIYWEPADIPTQGLCQLIVEKNVLLNPHNRAFKDVISRQECRKTAYTSVMREEGANIWICKDCIEVRKLRSGSKVEIKGQKGIEVVRLR